MDHHKSDKGSGIKRTTIWVALWHIRHVSERIFELILGTISYYDDRVYGTYVCS